MMKLIVGLGNPEKRYENTKHNTGFKAIDMLADKLNVELTTKSFNALIAKVSCNGETVILMKPLTYMNNSGEAVGAAVRYYHIDPEKDVLVVYDDMDLPVGKLRLREKGSSGGHNGVKSIIAHLNTQNFKRIRIGIGKGQHDTIDYVLSPFGKEEAKLWQEAIKQASEACYQFIDTPFQMIMEKYNRMEINAESME